MSTSDTTAALSGRGWIAGYSRLFQSAVDRVVWVLILMLMAYLLRQRDILDAPVS